MTNYEYYWSDIQTVALMCGNGQLAFDKENHQVTVCDALPCTQCAFNPHCNVNKLNWAYEEYVENESSVDWSQIPKDTKIYTSDDNEHWHPKYFAAYEDGVVYAWANGGTSFTAKTVIPCHYAKLAEE